MYRATLLIATRNRAEQLSLGLASLVGRYAPNIEILVVDDGSSDETPTVLKDFRTAIPQLRTHRLERNGGYRKNPSHVFNVGHTLASADIVVEQGGEVCHINDCVEPLLSSCVVGTVALARVFNGTPAQSRLVERQLPEYMSEETVRSKKPETNGDKHTVPKIGPDGVQLYCGAERQAPFLFLGAIHQDDWYRVGGYNEEIPRRNDEVLANSLLSRGISFAFVGDAVAFHLQHGKS